MNFNCFNIDKKSSWRHVGLYKYKKVLKALLFDVALINTTVDIDKSIQKMKKDLWP